MSWPTAFFKTASASEAVTFPSPFTSQIQSSHSAAPTAARRVNKASEANTAWIPPPVLEELPPSTIGSPHSIIGGSVEVVELVEVVGTFVVVVTLSQATAVMIVLVAMLLTLMPTVKPPPTQGTSL